MNVRTLICILLSPILLTCSVFAWNSTMLTVDNASFYHQFGDAVALSGDNAVLGSFGEPSVCFFSCTSGQWEQIIRVDSIENSDFGVSVDMDGEYAIVGARDYEVTGIGASGAAFIYHYDGSTWTEESILVADDGASGDWFGNYVAISGDYAVVGAERDDVGEYDGAGSAYVFHNDGGGTWTQIVHLTASDISGSAQFGWGIAISGETILVGARQADPVAVSSGAAYIYTYDGSNWVEQILSAADGGGQDYFGTSVDLSGDLAIIGAPGNDEGGDGAGAAYVFINDSGTWTQQQKFIGPTGDALGSGFGDDVAIEGDLAMVYATYASNRTSTVFVYQNDGSMWNELHYITPWTPGSHKLGKTISISGEVALLGDPNESSQYTSAGCGWIIEDLTDPSSVDLTSSYTIPEEFVLLPVYPNPFNAQTKITLRLPYASDLSVSVYNTTGQKVITLANSHVFAGQHQYLFDASGLPSGIYFIRATVSGNRSVIRKVILMK